MTSKAPSPQTYSVKAPTNIAHSDLHIKNVTPTFKFF